MSVLRLRIFLLFFGTISLAVSNLAVKTNKPTEEIERNDVSLKHYYERNDFVKDAYTQNQNDSYKDSPVLQTRATTMINNFGKIGSINYIGSYINMDQNGVHVQGMSPRSVSLSFIGKQVYLNNKVVCKDTSKLGSKVTYQKRKDGSMWYTNLQLGREMTSEEIEKFKAEAEKEQKQVEEATKQAMEVANHAMKQGVAAAEMGIKMGENAVKMAGKMTEDILAMTNRMTGNFRWW